MHVCNSSGVYIEANDVRRRRRQQRWRVNTRKAIITIIKPSRVRRCQRSRNVGFRTQTVPDPAHRAHSIQPSICLFFSSSVMSDPRRHVLARSKTALGPVEEIEKRTATVCYIDTRIIIIIYYSGESPGKNFFHSPAHNDGGGYEPPPTPSLGTWYKKLTSPTHCSTRVAYNVVKTR